MDNIERKIYKRGALLKAAEGFLLLLIAVIPLILTHSISADLYDWLIASLVTAASWSLMIAAVHFEIDLKFQSFDKHFLVIPASIASLLISFYVWLIPELRVLVLGGWFTVLLFGGSLYSLRQALWLSALMGVGYLCSLALLMRSGYPLNIEVEVAQAIPFWAFWAYSSKIIENHKRRREENNKLRRELTHLAFTDQLTGLGNRRLFVQELDQTIANTDKDKKFAIALFDIDRFKAINDQRGHAAGDDALIKFAAALKQSFSSSNMPCRLGGDEFVVLIHHASTEELKSLLENLFSRLSKELRGLFTVSCGVIITSANYTNSRSLRVADTALYEAKARGGNQFYIQNLDEVTKALSRAPVKTSTN